MDRESELELVGRLRDGDTTAFDEVYVLFNARLLAFVARLAGRREVAEDLVEETWLRLVGHARRLRPDTRLGPWLFTVARNLFISHCRARTVDPVAGEGGLDAVASGDASPFDATAASDFERRLECALASMPPTLREVLLLVGVEGMAPGEAAAVCGIAPEALRQRLKRARDLLSERLEGYERSTAGFIAPAAVAGRRRRT